MKILLADDDRNIRRSLSSFLKDENHVIVQAEDGLEAVERIAAGVPDLMLLDLRMPRKDGMAVILEVAPVHPDLPIIVLSGLGQLSDAVEAMRIGAWDYLSKPIEDLSTLTIAIQKVMERAALRKQLWEYQLHLEELVKQRTSELEIANQGLENRAIALREVLNTVQEDKKLAQQAIVSQIESTVLPLLARAKENASATARSILEQVEKNLADLGAPFTDQLRKRFSNLTPAELRICQAIRRSMTSKEIAQSEGISVETVETHRKAVRKKLNISNERVNLVTYLQSLDELA